MKDMARYLVTGVAGFIGSRVAELLLDEGHAVVGIDNLNAAYDVCLKQWRLDRIIARPGFRFHKLDITEREALPACLSDLPGPDGRCFDGIVNLAARAGVRYSV